MTCLIMQLKEILLDYIQEDGKDIKIIIKIKNLVYNVSNYHRPNARPFNDLYSSSSIMPSS